MQYKHLLLPQNYLAEEILLGTIFIYPDICNGLISFIKPEYFFLEHNKIICTCLQIAYKKKKVNFYEILETLEEIKILQTIGGIQKINNLMKQSQNFVSSFDDINFYLKEMNILLRQNYIKRLMIQYGFNIIKLGYIPKISYKKIYNKALLYLNTTQNNIPKSTKSNLQNLITEFILIKGIKQQDEKIKTEKDSLTSGFKEFDKITQGLSKGDLIIIAGRPSTGKTSFAINIICNILWKIKTIGIYFFSLEMSSKQILHKLISIKSHIPIRKIIKGKLYTLEWTKIIELCYQLINTNLQIDDNSDVSIDYIEYTTYLLKKKNFNIDLIVIDYLQLIQSNLTNKYNRSQELSYITRKLKLLAQTLNLPILTLSQLNRNIENRTDKTPILSDLKESGCISHFVNTYLKNKYEYKINCINIIDPLLNSTIIKNKYVSISKSIPKLTLSIEYEFCHQINKLKKILITYHHKLILYKNWLRQYFLVENSLLMKCYELQHLKKIKYSKVKYYFLAVINFSNYSKLYDIYIPESFHFFCQNIILHNSIEQDADIIIMIYNKEHKENYINKNKKDEILDLIICKNRNGPTGSFKLLFIPETTLFENYSNPV
uniref:DNA 5'-3' helicase n=1 Tax=Caloglossa monosticha TaxID=76906 RepID=A0A1Z1M5B6_9FLOR|nr:Replication helicase subunit [Caloglossa monosticha]ARW61122.1 Replication helicase subunit [Caloglossa monosticha]